MREDDKHEMYRLHVHEGLTAKEIAQKFGASYDRVRAVLYLLERRNEVMQENGVLNIPEDWTRAYDKYLDKCEELEALDENKDNEHYFGANHVDYQALADELEIDVVALKDIVTRYGHTQHNLLHVHI